FGALALTAACGGKIVDIGGQSTSQTLTPSTVTVANSQCTDGYAHSNICCTGGDKGSESTCEAWPDAPFHPCPDGWNTYPNAAQCCSLDNPADCTSCGGGSDGDNTANGDYDASGTPPTVSKGGSDICDPPTAYTLPDDGGPPTIDGGVGDVTACDPRCPPGYTGISPYAPDGCCTTDSSGAGLCFGEARAGRDDAGLEDAGPPTLPDGGPYDAGPAPDAGSNGTDPGFGGGGGETDNICDLECPPGWFLADAAGGVCCNNDSSGNEECFAIPFHDDNGGGGGTDVTPPSSGSGGVNPGGPEIDAGSAPTH
ncbi:MAG: hypothetical protein ACRELY_01615, partial [Polyangiaceae bacterium]